MSEINPFEYPPLVEWENCVTLQELLVTYGHLQASLKHLKWYEIRKKRDVQIGLDILAQIINWIDSGKRETTHETIN